MSWPSDRPRGVARPGALAVEALKTAGAQPVASALTVLLVAVVCAVILATTGQTVRAEEEVLARIDEAGTRVLTVTDESGGAQIAPGAVTMVDALSGVEWAVGFGFAQDAVNAHLPGGSPVPVRTLFGEPPNTLQLLRGRWPAPGEAVLGVEAAQTLGLTETAGGISIGPARQLGVVGMFRASDPLAALNGFGLAAPVPRGGEWLRSIVVLAESPAVVAGLEPAVRAVLDPRDPTGVTIRTSETLTQVRAAVRGELGRYSRGLVTAVLGAGILLIALNLYGSVMGRRRDYGRRRALGASRPTIVLLVVAQTTLTATVGAALGTAVGVGLIWRITGSPPGAPFPAAIAALALLSATLAAVPPALLAGFRDPVRVLRVP